MSAHFTIRDLSPGDRADWEALWGGYNTFYEVALDPVITELTWARLNDLAEPMFALVAARDDGKLIGLVQCVLHRGTWAVNQLCYLEDLFVADSVRGMGVGRALIEAVYARADTLKCDRVYWLTHETNQTARALYERIARPTGFIQYRRP